MNSLGQKPTPQVSFSSFFFHIIFMTNETFSNVHLLAGKFRKNGDVIILSFSTFFDDQFYDEIIIFPEL